MTGHRVLRVDDPAAGELLTTGWAVAHRSWAARLHVGERLALLAQPVAAAEAGGFRIGEAGPDADDGIAALEAVVQGDYPGGPATVPTRHDLAAITALRGGGTRFFTATDEGRVVAVTAIRQDGARAETDFTAVLPTHRRRGLAEAVKAASILALAKEGVIEFGTGGADENTASLAMNARLGYIVTERWLTLAPPA